MWCFALPWERLAPGCVVLAVAVHAGTAADDELELVQVQPADGKAAGGDTTGPKSQAPGAEKPGEQKPSSEPEKKAARQSRAVARRVPLTESWRRRLAI